MTPFWIISALLLAGALLFVVPPLLAQRERVRLSRTSTNLAIYRDQLHDLHVDLGSGALDKEHYDNARRELEARLLEDVADDGPVSTAPGRGRGAAIAASFAIPLCAVALYFIVGNPQTMLYRKEANQPGAAHGSSPQQVEALVARLAARMRQNPEDAGGWIMLGRSYQALGRFNQAAQAYTNAVARLPADAGLLADYADVLAMAQGRNLQGEPERIIALALAADPANIKALALAGTAAFENQDYARAVSHWERMLPLVPQDSDIARSIRAGIAEARALGGAPGDGRAAQGR